MGDFFDVTYDEEGYCGIALEDVMSILPLYKRADDLEDNENHERHLYFVYDATSGGIVDAMHQLASRIMEANIPLNNMRRVVWGYFLGAYEADDIVSLAKVIEDRRSKYWNLVETHRIDKITTMKSLNPQLFHPLAPVERNPWELSHRSKELLEEIWKDVERTYQERSLFTTENVRKTLQRVLYVWSKEHPYISYKQGMNEVLAVIYIACYRDQLVKQDMPFSSLYAKLFSGEDNDLEADAYILFDAIMSLEMQLMYDTAAATAPGLQDFPRNSANLRRVISESDPQKRNNTNSYIARTNYIYFVILKEYDEPLFNHLQKIGIEPHVFLMRWIRLIFSREFNVSETLHLWDFIFADHFLRKFEVNELPEFEMEMVDFFAVAMMSFVRINLLENDMSHCLQRLFKFPPIEDISHLISKSQKIRSTFCKKTNNVTQVDGSAESPVCENGFVDESDDIRDDRVGAYIPRQQHKEEDAYRNVNKPDRSKGDVTVSPYLLPKGVMGSPQSLIGGYADSPLSLMNIKRELENVSTRVYRLYDRAETIQREELMIEIEVVHTKLLHIIHSIDS
ncbi:putative TBC1 domain family member GTPase-activating protein [Babesia gibsoni]|uniref:TBC1 domain family member GTPase-activating protein n=1 Tax=Babesia gibsoni TaxID=33632 RepID=A0AAD8LHG4_BABGI|nr:putative TBC1 domain family member GTPase-activating protein [Babesia gibsoni]